MSKTPVSQSKPIVADFKAYSILNLPRLPMIQLAEIDGLLGVSAKLSKPILMIKDAQFKDPQTNLPINDKRFSAYVVISEGFCYIHYFDAKKEA